MRYGKALKLFPSPGPVIDHFEFRRYATLLAAIICRAFLASLLNSHDAGTRPDWLPGARVISRYFCYISLDAAGYFFTFSFTMSPNIFPRYYFISPQCYSSARQRKQTVLLRMPRRATFIFFLSISIYLLSFECTSYYFGPSGAFSPIRHIINIDMPSQRRENYGFSITLFELTIGCRASVNTSSSAKYLPYSN